MVVFLSLLIALVGMLMYILSGNPKIQELGRIMFAAGMFAFCFVAGPQVVGLLGK